MFVAVQDAELWIEDEGRGPPVLLPTGGGIEFYRRTLPEALRSELRLVYVDMRETGRSTGSMRGATFARMADDVDAVRCALGLERVAILGHSNHGSIALEYGLRHPDAAAAVICVGGVPDFTRALPLGLSLWERHASAEQKAQLARLQAKFAVEAESFGTDERTVRQYVALAPLAWRDPYFDPWPLWGGVPRGVGTYFPWIVDEGSNWSLVPQLSALRVPVLAVSGRHDYLCPVDLWREAIHALPDGRLEIFENSAHNPQYEEAERFAAVVGEFVRAHIGPRAG